MKLTKIRAGWYASEDGRFAAVIDGLPHISVIEREGDGIHAGITGGEWAAAYDHLGRLRHDHNAGQNLDWFKTKREAIDCLDTKARRLATQ